MQHIYDDENLQRILWNIWTDFRIFFISLFGFAALGFFMFLISRRKGHAPPIRSALNFVFPIINYKNVHTRVDLIVCTLNQLIWVPIFVNITTIIAFGTIIQHVIIYNFGVRDPMINNQWIVLSLQFIVYYLSGELSFYLAHLLMHKNPVLWSLHRPHHSAEVLTFLTSDRDHPLELVLLMTSGALIGGGSTAVFLYITGTSMHPVLPLALLAAGVAGEILDKLNHSHLRISFGPLSYIFQSSSMHQIHHSAETRHRDKNFGGTSSIFDWIFGTIYIPDPDESYRLGLSESELGDANPHKRVRDIYVEPIVYAWRTLKGKR